MAIVNGNGVSAGERPLVVSFGEMLIDFVPDEAGVSLAESTGFLKAPGGAPANVAVAIARLGGRSAFVGKVRGLPISTQSSNRSSPYGLPAAMRLQILGIRPAPTAGLELTPAALSSTFRPIDLRAGICSREAFPFRYPSDFFPNDSP